VKSRCGTRSTARTPAQSEAATINATIASAILESVFGPVKAIPSYTVRFPLTQPLPLARERSMTRRLAVPTMPFGIATIAAISSTA
jgi:hypothetical protein